MSMLVVMLLVMMLLVISTLRVEVVVVMSTVTLSSQLDQLDYLTSTPRAARLALPQGT